MLSAIGYFSLFPLLFHIDLILIRYCLYFAYVGYMYYSYLHVHKDYPDMSILEDCYIYGLLFIPIYEHFIGWLTGLNTKLPFLPLLMYSTYCAIGVLYCFIRYYLYALDLKATTTTVKTKKIKTTSKTKKNSENASLVKTDSESEPVQAMTAKTKTKPLAAKKKSKEKQK